MTSSSLEEQKSTQQHVVEAINLANGFSATRVLIKGNAGLWFDSVRSGSTPPPWLEYVSNDSIVRVVVIRAHQYDTASRPCIPRLVTLSCK